MLHSEIPLSITSIPCSNSTLNKVAEQIHQVYKWLLELGSAIQYFGAFSISIVDLKKQA